MKKLPTISVGIPAHNEEQNIAYMISSVLKQTGNFTLENVFVLCDGCTDKTASIVKKLAKKNPQIKLIDDGKRVGKAARLNQMYKLNTSQFLATLDADIVLERPIELALMLEEMLKHPQANVVAARIVPVKTDTFFGKIAEVSYKSFEDAVFRLNEGNNYYCLVGCSSLLRGSFAKSIQYPTQVVSDMNYLYTLATKNNPLGVQLAKGTRILFRTVTTFRDWRVLAIRSVKEDKQNLVSFFGEDILKTYKMPLWISLTSQLKWWFKSPIYMTGSMAMNVFIRLFPLKTNQPKNGVWEDTRSSKGSIIVAN